ncbi:MAG: hypothetical protein OS130_01180 [Thermodesulfobacteriota bacterium]|jgi:hypothetical protein|nr:MAG: hypothetical protein OS130_01180 [Thermodesulfobacteriota bacterium]
MKIISTIILLNGQSQKTFYDPSTPAELIIIESIGSSGVILPPHCLEEIIGTLTAGKGLLDNGFKISFKLPEFLGGAEVGLEKGHKKKDNQ